MDNVKLTFYRISIHAAREGGDSSRVRSTVSYIISIHAAREGGDDFLAQQDHDKTISIHAAREGGDTNADKAIKIYKIFQSTPPVKAATISETLNGNSFKISIHAAREGGD